MIGWVAKKIHGNLLQTNGQVVAHYYDSEISLCKENNLLSPIVDEYHCNFHRYCQVCNKMLKSKIILDIKRRENQYNKKHKEFIKKNTIEPEKVIINYLSYPHKDVTFHILDDVIDTLKKGWKNFDWKTCVLLCIISGKIQPGIIKYAKEEKIA